MALEARQPDLTLLLVEDDARTRAELDRILAKHAGLAIRVAATPEEALAAADVLPPPDLALIDLRLPGKDGLTLLDELLLKVPFLLAIIMTGYGEAETAREARERGAVDFVEKPLDLPYLLVVLRQLSREARLKRDLRAGAALMSGVLEMMPDGIRMADAAGTALYFNQIGRALWEGGHREPGQQALYEGRVYTLERRATGDRVLWHWIDLTRALEQERFAAYKQMARFLAHELRNPLTPMRLWLQELQSTPPGEEQFRETAGRAVEVLLGQVDRLMELAGRFRALGEMQAPTLQPVEVTTILREVEQALAPFAAKAGVGLAVKTEGAVRAMADESSLYHLLFNLVRNAVEASEGKGGTVSFGAGADGPLCVLTVQDRGGGLPPEAAVAPFTPYLTTKPGGTGLGLLICRELAASMGGRLVLCNAPGEGLTARVELKAGE